MNRKEFDKMMRKANKKAMDMDLEDFKRAVLRRIGELEVKMFYVGQIVGTDYEAVKAVKKLYSNSRKQLIKIRAQGEKASRLQGKGARGGIA